MPYETTIKNSSEVPERLATIGKKHPKKGIVFPSEAQIPLITKMVVGL